ncbi:MAG: hypothetical protein PVI57_22490 [Gemmatimonadota bacterium]|jgi:hypothetical protein
MAPLPDVLRESSGVAVSSRAPGAYWTVGDDPDPPAVYAVDAEGRLLDSIRLEVPARDWEDLAVAPCRGDSCLWIADTGDNRGRRDTGVVFRVPEPEPGGGGGRVMPAEAFRFRYPGSPRDVEAIFVLPGEGLHLVSKGTHGPPTLFRYPPPLRADSVVTLEEVQRLAQRTPTLPHRVTGAAASADGRTVAVRTYETLSFWRVGEEGLEPTNLGDVSLRTLREGQGEAVALGQGGEVVLTSEAGPLGTRGTIVVLRCDGLEERSPGSR